MITISRLRSLLTVCTVIFVQTVFSLGGQWSGRVTSTNGEPVVGAKVCSTTWSCIRTDGNGVFRLDDPFTNRGDLHFSADGFKPVTRWFPGHEYKEVALEKGSLPAWRVPKCGARRGGQWVGDGLSVLVPKGVPVVGGWDTDYWLKEVQFSQTERLQIGGGPTWSAGLPQPSSLKASVSTSERELKTGKADKEIEDHSIAGVDVRGTYADGKRWRFTGHAFVTFSYDGVSSEAAVFFDRIIDTLCCCR